jgi:hypothetical protein
MTDTDSAKLLNQRAAARLLGVSTSWLRSSSAPRLLLPGNGRSGQPLLRYSRIALLEWASAGPGESQQNAADRARPRQDGLEHLPQDERRAGDKSGGNSASTCSLTPQLAAGPSAEVRAS